MEINLTSFAFILSLIIFLSTFFKLVLQFKKNIINLPPGPTKLPIIGNLHLFLGSQPPHHTLTGLARKYGPVMRLQLGEVTVVVLSSAVAAKEVLKLQSAKFADRPTFVGEEILSYNNSNITLSPYGDYWRQLRKICTIELLSMKRVQSFRILRGEEFSKLCRWISSKEGSSINLTERVQLTTCDVVMMATLGKTTSELATFVSLAKEASGLMVKLYTVSMFTSIKLLETVIGWRRRVEKMQKLCGTIVENIIADHKLAKDVSGKREDLVDVLLKFNEPGHELYLTIDNIKAVLQDMIGAGIETSSTVVNWAMAEMLRHRRVLKKAQEEVRLVFNDKGFVDESDFDKLNYLKMVIKETLRMHPPLPLLFPRVSYEQCEIHGYEVPAKAGVIVNMWAMGRSSEYWKEAESFMPERFMENPVDFRGNNFEYIPFGAGRRICPGMSFGMANVELLLAMFLYHFNWALPDGVTSENLDMTETFGVVVRKKDPIHVIPVVRIPLPVK